MRERPGRQVAEGTSTRESLEHRIGGLEASRRRVVPLIWVLIALVILSGATGFGAARYYASGLEKTQRDLAQNQQNSCVDVRQARIIQRDSNAKTQAFLRIAQQARQQAANREEGAKKRSDQAAANLYKALADSYAKVHVPDCGLGPPPPIEPLPKLPTG